MAFYVKELQSYCLQWPSYPLQGWAQTTQRKTWDWGWTVHHQLTTVSLRGHYGRCCTKPPANSLFTLQPLTQKMPAYPPLRLEATAVTFWLIPIHETSNLATTPSVRDAAHTLKWYVKGDLQSEVFQTWNSHLQWCQLNILGPRETMTNRF